MKFIVERKYQKPPKLLDKSSLHKNLCKEMSNFLENREYQLYLDRKTRIVEINWRGKLTPMNFNEYILMIEFYNITDDLEFKLRW